jgi:hypothetical protein
VGFFVGLPMKNLLIRIALFISCAFLPMPSATAAAAAAARGEQVKLDEWQRQIIWRAICVLDRILGSRSRTNYVWPNETYAKLVQNNSNLRWVLQFFGMIPEDPRNPKISFLAAALWLVSLAQQFRNVSQYADRQLQRDATESRLALITLIESLVIAAPDVPQKLDGKKGDSAQQIDVHADKSCDTPCN